MKILLVGTLALGLAPLFLIRIASPAGALGRWIATGTERIGPTSMNRFFEED
jgi:hypothetical protein